MKTAELQLDKLEALAREANALRETIQPFVSTGGQLVIGTFSMSREEVDLVARLYDALPPATVRQLIDLARRAEPSVAADERALKALAEITNRLTLTYGICCGLAPKQAVGELLDVTLKMPEWEIVRAALARAPLPAQGVTNGDQLAVLIHYPECWDTAVYQNLSDALREIVTTLKCSECVAAPAQAGDSTRSGCDGAHSVHHGRAEVARAICLACEEMPDHIGDARGNAFRWQDYLDVADAAIAAMSASQDKTREAKS